MDAITSQGVFELFLVFAYSFGVYLLLSAGIRRWEGTKVRGVMVVPTGAGLIMVLALLFSYSGQSANLLRLLIDGVDRFWSIVLILAAIVGAIAVVDLLLNYVARITSAAAVFVARLVTRGATSPRWVLDMSMVPSLGVPIGIFLVVAYNLSPQANISVSTSTLGSRFVLEATYPLPAPPLALVFRTQNDGYIALDAGKIMRFELPPQPGGDLNLETVTEDVFQARGLAILNQTLFVTDTGLSPTTLNRPKSSTHGSVLAFDILADGELQNKRTIVSDLPVAGTYRAVNGIVVGPDERLYVPIGNSFKVTVAEENPLLGTVVSFAPDGSEFEVFARGICNIYDLTFDEQGRLYGVDNDGQTARGFGREEVLQIKHGAHYGHPYEGTYDLGKVRTDSPIWTLDEAAQGSAGIEWASRIGLGPGLLIGGPHLTYIPLSEDQDGFGVPLPCQSLWEALRSR